LTRHQISCNEADIARFAKKVVIKKDLEETSNFSFELRRIREISK
jgi:hypothetical protein